MLFDRTIKNISRIQEVTTILVRYGFEDVVSTTPLRKLLPRQTRMTWTHADRPVLEYSRWERIRMILEELGPTFVKLAQIVSNRADIAPQPLIEELQKLQSNVPPFSFEEVERIVKRELGKPIEEVFSYFDPRTIGSASLGQVHRARLIDGEEVVVKVQRPKARTIVETDLSLIKEFIKLTETYFMRQGIVNPLDIVETFERSMYKELDYLHEARNIEQFGKFYEDTTDFHVPRVYKSYSTEKILVMEYVRGCKITDVQQLRDWGLDPRKLAEKGIDIYLKQIFEKGYFHADPHPGNVIIQKDGTICLVDYGMVGKLTKKDKFSFAGVFISMARRDARSMAIAFRRLAIESEIPDMRRFEYDLGELIEEFASLDVSEMRMADLASALQHIIYTYRLKVPGSIFLILRALVILEGIGKTIYPDFKTFEFVKPYGAKIIREQYSFKNIRNELNNSLIQLMAFASTAPFDINQIIRNIRRGKLKIQVENTGYEGVANSISQSSKRLSVALVTFGFWLVTAIFALMPANPDVPVWYGLPIYGWITMSFALFSGFVLLLSMLGKR